MLDQLNTALGSRLCSQPGQATEVKCQANKSEKEALAVKRQCPLPTWDTASLPLEYPRVSAIIELKRSFHSLQIKHQVGISGVPVMAKRTGPGGWNSEETRTNGYWQFLNREPDGTFFSILYPGDSWRDSWRYQLGLWWVSHTFFGIPAVSEASTPCSFLDALIKFFTLLYLPVHISQLTPERPSTLAYLILRRPWNHYQDPFLCTKVRAHMR